MTSHNIHETKIEKVKRKGNRQIVENCHDDDDTAQLTTTFLSLTRAHIAKPEF